MQLVTSAPRHFLCASCGVCNCAEDTCEPIVSPKSLSVRSKHTLIPTDKKRNKRQDTWTDWAHYQKAVRKCTKVGGTLEILKLLSWVEECMRKYAEIGLKLDTALKASRHKWGETSFQSNLKHFLVQMMRLHTKESSLSAKICENLLW
jgi:hypothetical protein